MIHTGKIMVGISLLLLSIAMMVSPSSACGMEESGSVIPAIAQGTGPGTLQAPVTVTVCCPPAVPMPHTRTNV